jgi:hypothetical protein
MSQFNYIGSGNPASTDQPAAAAANFYDTQNNALWLASGSGFKPHSPAVISKTVLLAQTGAVAALVTYTAPVTGTYRVSVIAIQSTSTNGTLPTATVTYTDGDTGTASISRNIIASGVSTTGEGQSESGDAYIQAKVGTTIVIATGAPTTLTANLHARIEYVA